MIPVPRPAALARALLAAVAVLVVPFSASAQRPACDGGEREIRGIEFIGNSAYRDAELANAIALTPSPFSRRWLGLGNARCLDPLEFQRDLLRLRWFYRQRGYFHAQVDTVVTAARGSSVKVSFHVQEGAPARIESLRITGLDTVPTGARLIQFYEPMRGGVFSRVRLESLNDTILNRLRNEGYARAPLPLFSSSYDEATNSATVELDWIPGYRVWIDTIAVAIEPVSGEKVAIPERTVRDLLSVEEGDLVRQRQVLQSQRDLYQLETYRHVEIGLAPDSLQPVEDSLVRLDVKLQEGAMRFVRAGVGAGTIDCVRTQARYTDRNFAGGARRLEIEGRVSKIGASECPTSRLDPFSRQLNYFVGATIRTPTLFGIRGVPSLTLFSERRSEYRAYLRVIELGVNASVSRDLRPRTPLTVGYEFEYGRTDADEAVFCVVFNQCEIQTIEQLRQTGALHVGSVVVARDRTNDPFNPTRGAQLRVEGRYGLTATGAGTTTPFNRLLGEVSVYRAIRRNVVLAARLQGGGIVSAGTLQGETRYVPPQERLYGGGPNSVRGFLPNQLGPVAYVARSVQTGPRGPTDPTPVYTEVELERASPTGGNALLVANLEARVRSPFFPSALSWAFFADAGNVWNRRSDFLSPSDLKITPGVGVRLNTFVGPVRLDAAFNPYRAPLGPAFLIERGAGGEFVFTCVSPGVPVSGESAIAAATCPSTYQPSRRDGLLSRVRLQFSLGQPF